jgi:transposase
MDAREQKGLQIATSKRLRKKGAVWVVPSQTHAGSYVVSDDGKTCSCPDHEINAQKCKHVWAVEFARTREVMPDGTEKTVETMRVTYSQDWPAYHRSQQHEVERAAELLRALCDGIPAFPAARTGRPAKPAAEMVYAMVLKTIGGMSCRRAQSDLRAAEGKGHVDKAAHYNTVLKYMEDPRLTPILKALVTETAAPLKAVESHFAIDSSGFASNMYTRWYDAKYGRMMKKAQWVKTHVMSGVVTNVVTAVSVSDQDGADTREFPGLLATTAEHFDVQEVSGDKAYNTKKNLALVVAMGATPYIPFKSYSTAETVSGKKGNPLWARLWHFYEFNRGEFLAHYHKRSNAETVFSSVKRKFGANVRSRLPVAQENEVLCKFIAHNLSCLVHSIFELGIEPKFWPAG